MFLFWSSKPNVVLTKIVGLLLFALPYSVSLANQIGIRLEVQTTDTSVVTGAIGTLLFNVSDIDGNIIPITVTTPYYQAGLNCNPTIANGCAFNAWANGVIYSPELNGPTQWHIDIFAQNPARDLALEDVTRPFTAFNRASPNPPFVALFGAYWPNPAESIASTVSPSHFELNYFGGFPPGPPRPVGTVTLTQITAVPEPGSLAMMLAGMCLVAAAVRRKLPRY